LGHPDDKGQWGHELWLNGGKASSKPSAQGFAQGRVRSGEGDKEEMVPAPVPDTRG
jgi:hypothetical protein